MGVEICTVSRGGLTNLHFGYRSQDGLRPQIGHSNGLYAGSSKSIFPPIFADRFFHPAKSFSLSEMYACIQNWLSL